eukprot:4109036-Prymnesium_polylepis.1
MPRRVRRRAARCAQHVSWADAQPQTPSHAAAAVDDAATPQARALLGLRRCERTMLLAAPRANARKRRSRVRSAQRHAARSQPIRPAANLLLYLVRLRRLVITDSEMSEYATSGSSGSTRSPSKRGREHELDCERCEQTGRRPSGRLRDGGWMTTGSPSADRAMSGIVRCRRGL